MRLGPTCLLLAAHMGCGTVHMPRAVPPDLPKPVTQRRIESNRGWQPTGVHVRRDDVVSIVADGMWSPYKGMCNANGMHFPFYRYTPLWLIFYCPNPMPSQSVNLLIGRVGKGPLFAVGASRVFVADQPGELLLRPNDWYLLNSKGSLRVRVHVERSANSRQ